MAIAIPTIFQLPSTLISLLFNDVMHIYSSSVVTSRRRERPVAQRLATAYFFRHGAKLLERDNKVLSPLFQLLGRQDRQL